MAIVVVLVVYAIAYSGAPASVERECTDPPGGPQPAAVRCGPV